MVGRFVDGERATMSLEADGDVVARFDVDATALPDAGQYG